MYEAYVFACLGTAILLDVSFVGGTILAIIEYIHDKHANIREDADK